MSPESKNIYPDVKPGAHVKVHQEISDVTAKGEERKRIQIFEGLVLCRKGGNTPGAAITVRKVSEGIGVEKIFPLYLPTIKNIEVVSQLKVRRANIKFARTTAKRMKEVKK